MKRLKNFLLFPACCIAMLLPAGCNGKTYSVYSNMPQSIFEITEKNFKAGDTIGGYVFDNAELEDTDTSAYTSRRRNYPSMNTGGTLVVTADFEADGAEDNYTAFYKAVGAELNKIDKAVSTTVTDSDIDKFNKAQAGAKLQISETCYEILCEAKSVYALTEGYYNPALYYNIQAYGFGGAKDYPKTSAELPKDEIIAKYTELASHFGDIKLETNEEEGGTVYFVTKPEYTVEAEGEVLSMKLDLGGIGKGYAVDAIDKLFDEYGYKYGNFSFGTSSMVAKSFAEKGDYVLGLLNPRSFDLKPYLTTHIRNEKLSTSGDNEQCYFIDGTRYCHIISPKTGKPVQTGIMTVTVIGGSAAEDDALTTAIMAMEKEDAISFIEQKLSDRKVVFACEN